MKSTIELLDRALRTHKASDWARRYNITQATFNNARKRGFLSSTLAGNLAIDLGEDAQQWMAIAAIESERESPLRERLIASLSRQKS